MNGDGGRPARPRRRGFIGPFSAGQVVLAIGSVIVAAVLLVIVTAPLGTAGSGALPNPVASAFLIGPPVPGLRPGTLAPELAGTGPNGSTVGLQDLDGHPVRLADLRGRAVWLNFWATWCPPCQSETPTLRDVSARYRDRGLVLVAVDVQETVEGGRQYAERYGLPYLIGADVSGAVLRTYRVYALPTQFFIDANGVIREVLNGPLDEATAEEIVTDLLPTSSPSQSP